MLSLGPPKSCPSPAPARGLGRDPSGCDGLFRKLVMGSGGQTGCGGSVREGISISLPRLTWVTSRVSSINSLCSLGKFFPTPSPMASVRHAHVSLGVPAHHGLGLRFPTSSLRLEWVVIQGMVQVIGQPTVGPTLVGGPTTVHLPPARGRNHVQNKVARAWVRRWHEQQPPRWPAPSLHHWSLNEDSQPRHKCPFS